MRSLLLGLLCVCGGMWDIWSGHSTVGRITSWFHLEVNRSDAPTLFWIGVGTWFVMAAACFVKCSFDLLLLDDKGEESWAPAATRADNTSSQATEHAEDDRSEIEAEWDRSTLRFVIGAFLGLVVALYFEWSMVWLILTPVLGGLLALAMSWSLRDNDPLTRFLDAEWWW